MAAVSVDLTLVSTQTFLMGREIHLIVSKNVRRYFPPRLIISSIQKTQSLGRYSCRRCIVNRLLRVFGFGTALSLKVVFTIFAA